MQEGYAWHKNCVDICEHQRSEVSVEVYISMKDDEQHSGEITLAGKSISPGIGVGFAQLEELIRPVPQYEIQSSSVEAEQSRLHIAFDIARRDLKLHIKSAHGLEDGELNQVLKAHEMMLNDQEVLGSIERRIEHRLINAEWAVSEELETLIIRFEKVHDPYLQARSEDIKDMEKMIQMALAGRHNYELSENSVKKPQVMITCNLFPSLAMKAQRERFVGFATESQAVYSHAAIIMKGLGIPVVGSVPNLSITARVEDRIIVDGINGMVIVRPSDTTFKKYIRLQKEFESFPSAGEYLSVDTKSHDGLSVELMANIGHPNQMPLFLKKNFDGIGLFRTEFMAIERGNIPTEEEQLLLYQGILDRAKGKRVVIRTFDIGADKHIPGIRRCSGMNPALGVRGIRRHLLYEPEELQIQLRAILRSAVNAPIGILFPMITNMNDIEKIKDHLNAAKADLARNGEKIAKNVRIGAMIEVPAAAILTSDILKQVDFISVGTNDLLQYFTGADRDNPEVLSYLNPYDPSFQWLLEYIAIQAKKIGRLKDVTICGEIAGDTDIVQLLMRAGFRSFSISPVVADEIRYAISQVSIQECSSYSATVK